MSKFLRFLLYLMIILLSAIAGIVTWYYFDTQITPPDVNQSILKDVHRETIEENHYTAGNSWLRKNKYGLWEMYLEGSPFEIGVANGVLTKELIYKQEKAFVEQIKKIIPSESYLDFLKYFVKFFNRDIEEYIIPEYRQEIYGISFSASDDFTFIGSNYDRLLNYHAAHDIGHALQDLMLVGCTSFAANMGYTDSSLIIGRNFDFYINDAFAENKIICFVKPEKGYQFAYVTWASMIGVVSGMNDQGLTVTINAGKSDIPFKSATPISLLAREILQYASDIEQAIAIAEKRETFVAESLLIGSAQDNKSVILEKSPSKFGTYQTNDKYLICANHFQSNVFSTDQANRKQILETASSYRQNRAKELLGIHDTLTYMNAASILRDKKGMNGSSIGIGNEKAMTQMISHHSVIFLPMKQKMWVSSSPYQLGEYVGYQLDEVFDTQIPDRDEPLYDSSITIPLDPFYASVEFENFKKFKEKREILIDAIRLQAHLNINFIKDFTSLNPDYFQAYVLAGDYFASIQNNEKALQFYHFSLKKEFENSTQRKEVENKINKLEKR